MHILNNFTCLVVEDDRPKLDAVVATINEIRDRPVILTAGSVASAIEIISKNTINFAVIDMSLPAFDFATDMSGGGKPQGSGGRDILRFLEDEQPSARAVILTQYEEFNARFSKAPPQKLEIITTELQVEFGDFLLSVIYYSGRRGVWKEELKHMISTMLESL